MGSPRSTRRAQKVLGRRAFSVGVIGTLGAACESAPPPKTHQTAKTKMTGSESHSKTPVPVVFVGHGAPTLALDEDKGRELRTWGEGLEGVRAILSISAHYTPRALSIGTTRPIPLIYDFSGFPKELYQVQYPAPGAPDLAEEVEALLAGAHPVVRDDRRGHDHGTWVPLVHLRPKADLPVLSLSLPLHYRPEQLVDLGRRLAPLRDAGVLVMASGNVTHNLRAIRPDGTPPAAWAQEFDDWCRDVLDGWDLDALVRYEARAPALAQNHPTVEHFVPLLVAAGAVGEGRPAVRYPVTGFEYGNLSRRSVELS